MSKRQNSVYSEIAKDIVSKIKSGAYKLDSTLPSERELKEIYGVERTTIRRALELLCDDGYICKKAGIGSVIVSDTKTQPKVQLNTSGDTSSLICITPSSANNYLLQCANALCDLAKTQGINTFTFSKLENDRIFDAISGGKNVSVVFFGCTSKDIGFFCEENGIFTMYAFEKTDGKINIIPDLDTSTKEIYQIIKDYGHERLLYVTSKQTINSKMYSTFANKSDFDIVTFSDVTDKDTASRIISSSKASCIVCEDRMSAIYFEKAAQDLKISLPEELSVASLFSTNLKDTNITSAFFDKNTIAAEILSTAISKHLFDTNVSITKLIHHTICGTTLSKPYERVKRHTISDFLL